MKGSKQGAMVFLILGMAMLAIGASGQRAFLVIGAVFIALAAATFARFRRSCRGDGAAARGGVGTRGMSAQA